MGTKSSKLVKNTYHDSSSHKPQCMFDKCTRKSADLFIPFSNVAVHYLPVPVVLLRHLGLIVHLKRKASANTITELRFCKKHSKIFFELIVHTLLYKYGEKLNNVAINALMTFVSPLDVVMTKNILTTMRLTHPTN